jgi:very-short-patch-repair endonuclease
MPEMFCVAGEIRYALPPRAVADTVWGLTDLSQVRAIVAESVQTGRCHIARLAEELAAGPMRGSARLRQVIAEVSVGVRSVAEAELHELIEWAGLPMPMFNPRLFVGKEFIGSPDCWWPGAGVAVEVDSKAWHLSPQDWEKTLARHALMSAHGIVVLHFTPRQIRTQRQTVAARIQSSLTSDRSHPLPHIKALPAH